MAKYLNSDGLTHLIESFANIFKAHTHSFVVDAVKKYKLTFEYSRSMPSYDEIAYLPAWVQNTKGTDEDGVTIVAIPKTTYINRSEIGDVDDKGTLGWVRGDASVNDIVTRNFLAYWNGAYNYGQDTESGIVTYRSYLQYCDKGRFGNGAIRNIGSGTSSPTDTIFTQVTGVAPVDGDIYIMISEG